MGKSRKKKRDIDMVIDGVEGLCSMSCIDPRKYAMEDGWAHIVAKDIQKKIKMNQLRKFFESVKSIKVELKKQSDKNKKVDDIPVVKQRKYELFPELAYALARELITEDFYDLMTMCLKEKVVSVKDFETFDKFLSAIVAYHKMCEWISKQKRGGEQN